MKLISFIAMVFVAFIISSCSTSIPCSEEEYKDSDKLLMASGQGSSSRENTAIEIAIVDAKQKLAAKMESYVEKKYLNQTINSDEAYLEKVRTAQKTAMSEVSIQCTVVKKHKGKYIAYVAVDADISNIETIIRETSDKPKSKQKN